MDKLLTKETIEAYTKRIKSMQELKFSEEGNIKFIEEIVAESEQIENLHVKARINDKVIENDEPESLGGFNKAPRPMDTLLASLANCLEISALLYFSFSNLKVKSVKVKVLATFDKRAVLPLRGAPMPGFYDIKYIWYIDTDESEKRIEKVLDKVNQNCPVKGTFSRSHEFPHEIKIERAKFN